ncbi:MAG: 1-acyl-sn-glycerol-3-phosphate acyltransferase [Bacteroidales bacterium]|nr:1-acyl-sn-glycerol-3-phosphate acyltransferase [Bacteroidales bacterium]
MKYPILYTYTLLSYAVLYPFTFLATITILVMYHIGLRKQIPAVIWFWAHSSFLLIGKYFTIEGRENFDKSRKYILLSNHSSLLDIMGIMAICANISWFGRANLMQIPVFRSLLQVINYIPMQSTNINNTKNMVGQMIRNSVSQTVAIFPEGTRTTNGNLNRFHKGFIHVMKASKLDILPVTLNGFYEFKPKNRFYFDYPVKLSAKIHPPIPYHELVNLEDKEIISRVRSRIESAL